MASASTACADWGYPVAGTTCHVTANHWQLSCTTTTRNGGNPMSSPLQIVFVMDPVEQVNIDEDTTFALMLEAQEREQQLAQPRELSVQELRLVEQQQKG